MPTASTATDTWHHLDRVTRPATLTQRCQKSSSPRSGRGDSSPRSGEVPPLAAGMGLAGAYYSPFIHFLGGEVTLPHALGKCSSPRSGKMLFPTQWGSTAACGGDGARRSLLLPNSLGEW